MADNNDELNESSEELIEMFQDLERQGKLTRADLEKLARSTSATAKAQEALGKATADGIAGFKNMALSVGGGSTEIDTMKTVVTATGNAIAGLLEAIPFVGAALGALTRAATEVANLAIERLQVSFNAFQELSKQGMIGAKGISGLRDAMITTQIPMEKFAKILGDAAPDLMFLTGSAVNGGKMMTSVMTKMQAGQDMNLRRLGFSIEEIGETVVDFSKMNRLLGVKQQLSTEQLANGTVKYGHELALIAKLTGMQRKEIQKNREQMMNDTRFSAWANQQEGQVNKDALKATMDFVGGIKKLAPTMGQGIQDLFASGGVATTDAGKRLIQQGMGPTVQNIKQQMLAGTMDQAQAQRAMFTAALENKDKFRDLSAIIGDFGAGIPFEEMLRLAKSTSMSDEAIQKMKDDHGKAGKSGDGLTNSLIGTQKALQKAQTNIDAIATSGDVAAKAINFMANTMNDLSFYIKTTIMGMNSEAARVETNMERRSMAAGQRGLKGSITGEGKDARFMVDKEQVDNMSKRRTEVEARKAEIESIKLKRKLTATESAELKSMNIESNKLKDNIIWARLNSEKVKKSTMWQSDATTDASRGGYNEIMKKDRSDEWGDYDVMALLKGAGISESTDLSKEQIKKTIDLLDKFVTNTGGKEGFATALDATGSDKYKAMQQELASIRGIGGGEHMANYQSGVKDLRSSKKKNDADGWTNTEAEEYNRQLVVLSSIEALLKRQDGNFVAMVDETKKQTATIKQVGSN